MSTPLSFLPVPQCSLTWMGSYGYNGGYRGLTEQQIELKVVDQAFISIEEPHGVPHLLTPEQAQALLDDLISASAGQMYQKDGRSHPFVVSTKVAVYLTDGAEEDEPMPGPKVDELMAWLEYVLGHQAWDPRDIEWEW